MSCVPQGVGRMNGSLFHRKIHLKEFTSGQSDRGSEAELCCQHGRGGNSANCKVKLTPPLIVSLYMPLTDSITQIQKDKDVSSPLSPGAAPSKASLSLYTHRFIHYCWLTAWSTALEKRIKTELRKKKLTVKPIC